VRAVLAQGGHSDLAESDGRMDRPQYAGLNHVGRLRKRLLGGFEEGPPAPARRRAAETLAGGNAAIPQKLPPKRQLGHRSGKTGLCVGVSGARRLAVWPKAAGGSSLVDAVRRY
jgi:hypothetical protein